MVRFGIWHNQGFSGSGDMHEGLESWDTLKDAEYALQRRYEASHASFRNAIHLEGCLFMSGYLRGFDIYGSSDRDHHHIDLYDVVDKARWVSRKNDDNRTIYDIAAEPYMRLSLGPRGGVIRESF